MNNLGLVDGLALLFGYLFLMAVGWLLLILAVGSLLDLWERFQRWLAERSAP